MSVSQHQLSRNPFFIFCLPSDLPCTNSPVILDPATPSFSFPFPAITWPFPALCTPVSTVSHSPRCIYTGPFLQQHISATLTKNTCSVSWYDEKTFLLYQETEKVFLREKLYIITWHFHVILRYTLYYISYSYISYAVSCYSLCAYPLWYQLKLQLDLDHVMNNDR